MSRLLPRLLADREYFEMSQGLLEFILVVLGLVDYNQPLPQLKKYEMKKYHLVGARFEKNKFRLAVQYTANVYRQTTDKLMLKSVISTVR